MNISTTDQTTVLNAVHDLGEKIRDFEYVYPDFTASLLHKMRKIVDEYGPRHGVTPRRLDGFTAHINVVDEMHKVGIVPLSIQNKTLLRETAIKDVIFNGPATVIVWSDGTKTVVKCQPDDNYSKEAGVAIAIMKKVFGNKGNYNNVLKRLVEKGTDVKKRGSI